MTMQPSNPSDPLAPFTVRTSDGEEWTYVRESENPAEYDPDAPKKRAGFDFGPGLEAELLIGLNVGPKPTWRPFEIRDGLYKLRLAQLQALVGAKKKPELGEEDYGATIFSGLGFWGKINKKTGVKERSVSVRIFRLGKAESPGEFMANMKELGYRAAERFKQKQVIVRVSRGGGLVRGNICEFINV